MNISHIIDLDDVALNEKEASETPPELLLSGIATTWCREAFSRGAVSCGIWESEAFSKVKMHPTSMEYCFILEGKVKLTDSNGASRVFGEGDAFVVEPGFDGVWESLGRVRKHYVLCEV